MPINNPADVDAPELIRPPAYSRGAAATTEESLETAPGGGAEHPAGKTESRMQSGPFREFCGTGFPLSSP